LPALAGAGLLADPIRAFAQASPAAAAPAAAPNDGFPRVDPAAVEAFVGVAHRDAAEVLRMVEKQPALANAAWDWGFGDWETALGAAAHTGRREVAEVVLAHGATPTLFSAAMLGQLDVVKSMVAARPGVQSAPGPHGLTLLHHARAGGKDAEAVVAFLEAAGGADERPALAPLEKADRDALVGRYRFGAGERDRFDVEVRNDRLSLQRAGGGRILLHHTGELVFFPSGVPSVKIAFARSGAAVSQLAIAGSELQLTAKREA
jgi:hypothetical protein